MKNRLFFYWNIGKNVYEKQNFYDNSVDYYSKYLSYCIGNSYTFSKDNIKIMEKFYLTFPIFYDALNKLSWDQYKLLLNINNKEERYFYYKISLLFNSDLEETIEFINNDYYCKLEKNA